VLVTDADVVGTDDVVCWMGEVVVVLGFVVVCVVVVWTDDKTFGM